MTPVQEMKEPHEQLEKSFVIKAMKILRPLTKTLRSMPECSQNMLTSDKVPKRNVWGAVHLDLPRRQRQEIP